MIVECNLFNFSYPVFLSFAFSVQKVLCFFYFETEGLTWSCLSSSSLKPLLNLKLKIFPKSDSSVGNCALLPRRRFANIAAAFCLPKNKWEPFLSVHVGMRPTAVIIVVKELFSIQISSHFQFTYLVCRVRPWVSFTPLQANFNQSPAMVFRGLW